MKVLLLFLKKITKTGNYSTVQMGFTDSVSATAPTDGVYFSIANLTLMGRVRTNSVETNTSNNYNITEGLWYRAVILFIVVTLFVML